MSELVYATRLFKAFEDCSTTTGGITRETYGEGENRAHKVFEANAHFDGLMTYTDAALNTWTGSPRGRPVVLGSHLDSVPRGGNFDGAAGVVAGLLVAKRMKGKGVQVVALRGEESAWFGECYLGSKALLKGWSEETMERKSRTSGLMLRETLGLWPDPKYDPGDKLPLGRPLRSPKTIRAFLELHIEQGPVLDTEMIPLGIVTGIRGNVRHTVTCIGEAGHSGTTPMDVRKDAVAAVVKLLDQWNDRCQRFSSVEDLVATTGILHTDRDVESVSAIAGKVTFSVEWRSRSKEMLKNTSRAFRVLLANIETDTGCTFSLSAPISSAPVGLSKSVQRALAQACEETPQVAYRTMPSGAGHDAAVFAKAGVPTGMLFVRNQHGSHNPSEAMNMDDFMAGVDVLHAATVRLAKL